MKTPPTFFDSLLTMLGSSGAETARVQTDRIPNWPWDGIGSNLFATAADKEGSDDQKGDTKASIRTGMQILAERLDRIEMLLARLLQQRTVKEQYAIAEVAEILGKAEFTVREWCRLGRVRAQKRPCGRGRSQEWMIAHTELLRIQNEGLLPQPTISTRIR